MLDKKTSLTRRAFLKWTTIASVLPVTSGLVPCARGSPPAPLIAQPVEWQPGSVPPQLVSTLAARDPAAARSGARLLYGADKVSAVRCGQGDVCGAYHVANVFTREGQIVGYEGCPQGQNAGGLCARGWSAMQTIYSPDRVKYPMLRKVRGSDEWTRISWDEAYDLLATKMVEAMIGPGPQTVGVFSGHTMTNTTKILGRFRGLFNFASAPGPGVCWDNLAFGPWPTLGDYSHIQEEDFHASKLIILWGHNVPVGMPSDWSEGIMVAKHEHGAKIVVIDPYFSPAAEKADLFIPVRPGTDAALALGIANVLITENLYNEEFVRDWTVGFDEYKALALQYPPERVEEITWAPADRIRALARWYAEIKPALLEVGRGGNFSAGNSGWLASRGLSCLIGLTGQIGERGAGFSVEASTKSPSATSFGDWPFNSLTQGLKPLYPLPEGVKLPSGPHQGQQIIYYGNPYTYQVLLIIGSEMAAKWPSQDLVEAGLARIPFIAAENRFTNYTAHKFADLVLPNALWTEQAMIQSEYTHMLITGPATKPMFEAKPTYLMVSELSDRIIAKLIKMQKLTIEQPAESFMPWRTDAAIVNAMLTNKDLPNGGYPNLTYEEAIKHPEGIRGSRPYNQEGYVWFREDGDPQKPLQFYTPSGKIEFKSQQLADKFNLPALPVHEEPPDSPLSTPEAAKEYPLVANARIHRHHGFLQYSLIKDGGNASPIIRETFLEAAQPTVELNPATAAQYGLQEGDMVWVESRYGKLQGRLHLNERVHPKMAITPYHWSNLQNRITPPEISLFRGISIDQVGPYGAGKKLNNLGGQSTQAGFLCKVYKA